MQSMTTFLRAVVMLLALAIGWMGWKIYGPTSQQLRTIASRAVEIAEEALEQNEKGVDGAVDPRLAPMAQAPRQDARTVKPTKPATDVLPAAAELLPAENLVAPARYETFANEPTTPIRPLPEVGGPGSDSISPLPQESNEAAQRLIARLEASGVLDPQLEPWGSSGELYRFSCRVPWGGEVSYTRHFESVAREPTAAVEAVAEEVDAWRLAKSPGAVVR